MPKTEPRIDAYIAKAAPFAQPILTHLRTVVHAACPDVEETIKWQMPFFLYHGILCNMAAFKQHCAFGLWKAGSIVGGASTDKEDAMGHFGRITSLADLPPRATLEGYIRAVMRRNEEAALSTAPAKAKPQAKSGARTKQPKAAPRVPDELTAALKKNANARATFEGFSPSHRREYIDWIVEAKTDATRSKRLTQAVEWMAEGKPRMWKYMKGRS
jgi:uncharacterized protein YdeI (YjbR/CyaY-like superfamily)